MLKIFGSNHSILVEINFRTKTNLITLLKNAAIFNYNIDVINVL